VSIALFLSTSDQRIALIYPDKYAMFWGSGNSSDFGDIILSLVLHHFIRKVPLKIIKVSPILYNGLHHATLHPNTGTSKVIVHAQDLIMIIGLVYHYKSELDFQINKRQAVRR
jgi:hypothetical protein